MYVPMCVRLHVQQTFVVLANKATRSLSDSYERICASLERGSILPSSFAIYTADETINDTKLAVMKDPLFHHDHDINTRQNRRIVQGRCEAAEAAEAALYIPAAPTREDLEETKSLEIPVALRRLNPRHLVTPHCFRRDTCTDKDVESKS